MRGVAASIANRFPPLSSRPSFLVHRLAYFVTPITM
jgi:hypothetical protein